MTPGAADPAPGSEGGAGRPTSPWRSPRVLAIVALLALAGVTVGWALSTLLSPPRPPAEDAAFSLYRASNGNVASTIALNTAAEWSAEPTGVNLSAGTVTTVRIDNGDLVKPGTVLYTVNLRPTVIAAGGVPSFRAMQSGTRGPDVEQLQKMLTTLGFYDAAIDGSFGAQTTQAVRRWQERLGITVDGVVQAGDVIFVKSLPARVALDSEELFSGGHLSGGERLLSVLPAEPAFTIPVTEGQVALAPEGTRVEIEAPDETVWEAFVTGVTRVEDEIDLTLEGPSDGSICGELCGLLPVGEQTLLPSTVFTVEDISGIVVPTAALKSDAGGDVLVIDEDGVEHEVVILGSAHGMSAIRGIPSGTMVRVPPGS